MSDSVEQHCPYLDTINRTILDFDFEKMCSVSLSRQNVYACLVCGRYFQGRGKSTHAYAHSLDVEHHVFISLHDGRIYCLPDNYEVKDPSLDDIRSNLRPKFSSDSEIKRLLHQQTPCIPLAASDSFERNRGYYPGLMGLNNIDHNDALNALIQVLMSCEEIKSYFAQESNWCNSSPLVRAFGELCAKGLCACSLILSACYFCFSTTGSLFLAGCSIELLIDGKQCVILARSVPMYRHTSSSRQWLLHQAVLQLLRFLARANLHHQQRKPCRIMPVSLNPSHDRNSHLASAMTH